MEVAAGVSGVVLMLRLEVTGVPVGVTDAGVKPQMAPVGKLTEAQLNTTAPVKPFAGVTVTV